jgi:penicillin-binding protein 1A
MTPATALHGLTALAPQGREEWTPRNVSGEIEDRLTLRQAFFESNNRAAVALQQKVGTRLVLRLASSLGVPDQPDVPSLALGTGLVTPLQLTAAYAAFPNGGNAVAPHAILRVVDDAGGIALEEPDELQRAMPEDVAFQVVSLMTDVIDRGTGTAVRSWGVRFPVAGKTGTTNDFKDAWFVGYSQHLVAGVWVGFDQPATIRKWRFGARVALPIWPSSCAGRAAWSVPGVRAARRMLRSSSAESPICARWTDARSTRSISRPAMMYPLRIARFTAATCARRRNA